MKVFSTPDSAIECKAERASGPGGQNVNKVSSRIEMRVVLARIQGLTESARARLQALCTSRLDADGLFLVTSQLTRDQGRSLEDAKEKVRVLVAQAVIVNGAMNDTTDSARNCRERNCAAKTPGCQAPQHRCVVPYSQD